MSAQQASDASASHESHLLYVLLDSNIPTGGFVASSGLESYAQHGFLRGPIDYARSSPSTTHSLGRVDEAARLLPFIEAETENFASTTSCFVRDSWRVAAGHLARADSKGPASAAVEALTRLDALHEATLLSHVARRASKTQGVAMLTLFTRGLSDGELGSRAAAELVEQYKLRIRQNTTQGHLAVCWGTVMACLGIKLERALHLYLFLHVRAVLSAAVRLNIIGPYASIQLLLHPCETLIRHQLSQMSGAPSEPLPRPSLDQAENWGWAEDADQSGPCTTWPLGEIIAGRHDMQHSRIFNS